MRWFPEGGSSQPEFITSTQTSDKPLGAANLPIHCVTALRGVVC
jgi:hypothetical protein